MCISFRLLAALAVCTRSPVRSERVYYRIFRSADCHPNATIRAFSPRSCGPQRLQPTPISMGTGPAIFAVSWREANSPSKLEGEAALAAGEYVIPLRRFAGHTPPSLRDTSPVSGEELGLRGAPFANHRSFSSRAHAMSDFSTVSCQIFPRFHVRFFHSFMPNSQKSLSRLGP